MQVISFDEVWLDKAMKLITNYLNRASKLPYTTSPWAWVHLRGLADLHATNRSRFINSLNRNLQRPGPNSARDAIEATLKQRKGPTTWAFMSFSVTDPTH